MILRNVVNSNATFSWLLPNTARQNVRRQKNTDGHGEKKQRKRVSGSNQQKTLKYKGEINYKSSPSL